MNVKALYLFKVAPNEDDGLPSTPDFEGSQPPWLLVAQPVERQRGALPRARDASVKSSCFSFVAAATLFASTAASAAPFDHDRDLRRLSPRERARVEQAERARERQQAIEQARWEAQHHHDRGPVRPYGHR